MDEFLTDITTPALPFLSGASDALSRLRDAQLQSWLDGAGGHSRNTVRSVAVAFELEIEDHEDHLSRVRCYIVSTKNRGPRHVITHYLQGEVWRVRVRNMADERDLEAALDASSWWMSSEIHVAIMSQCEFGAGGEALHDWQPDWLAVDSGLAETLDLGQKWRARVRAAERADYLALLDQLPGAVGAL